MMDVLPAADAHDAGVAAGAVSGAATASAKSSLAQNNNFSLVADSPSCAVKPVSSAANTTTTTNTNTVSTVAKTLASVSKASLSNAPAPRPKYVPIRPCFRPLLPKPSPNSGSGSCFKKAASPDLLHAPASTAKPKPSSRAAAAASSVDKPNKQPKSAKPAKAKSATATSKASKAKAKKQQQQLVSNDSLISNNAFNDNTISPTTAMTFTTSSSHDIMSTKTASKKPRKASTKKHQLNVNTNTTLTISPASLITKRAKSTSSTMLADTLSPLHMALSAAASNIVNTPMSGVSSLPSPHSSPCSSPSAILESITLDTVMATTPPLDTWATQTADEILAASATEDFFWLSPKSLVSDLPSSLDHQSLSLSTFQDSSPEPDDDYYMTGSEDFSLDAAAAVAAVINNSTTGGDSATTTGGDYSSGANTAGGFFLNATAAAGTKSTHSYDPEPFCAFEFSPEPVSMLSKGTEEEEDPYGFLDLAINI